MKTLKALFLISLVSIALVACESQTKADTWTAEQKTEWTESCLQFMESKEVEADQAKNFCDCMLEKTSAKYTSEEAAKITEEEERKLWESCDFRW